MLKARRLAQPAATRGLRYAPPVRLLTLNKMEGQGMARAEKCIMEGKDNYG
jgi:hypothetical protein